MGRLYRINEQVYQAVMHRSNNGRMRARQALLYLINHEPHYLRRQYCKIIRGYHK